MNAIVSNNLPTLSNEGGLSAYLDQIKKFPMLAAEEEYMLAKNWKTTGNIKSAEKLVTSHLRLVAKIAMGYKGYGLPVNEMISEGNVGLMQAVKKFEPEKGFRLATYAMWWIKAAIQEYVLRSWSLVKMGTTTAQKKLFFNLKKIKNQIAPNQDGDLKDDQVKEISKRLDVESHEVINMNRRMMGQEKSLNEPIKAGEKGKSVTAVVEIKARFDEEANLAFAYQMEKSGVQIVYGFANLKTHSKASLIIRKEFGKLRSYAHVGTGNYHPINAKIYEDLSLFTANEKICRDIEKVFNYVTGYAKPRNLNKISISPINLRKTLNEQIDKEILNSKKGKKAEIWAKMNSLVDPDIIDKFYEASNVGVKINLFVRGVCCLRPGLKNNSENIVVKSIIGRFLEHSRIYCFANGKSMPSREAKVFISSADLMPRNLNRRVELLVPIENKTVHEQVLDQIMLANYLDKKQSWVLNADGDYKKIQYSKNDSFSAHDYFMNNPSLSGRGKAKLKMRPKKLNLKAV